MRQGTGNEPHFDWVLDEGERGREVWYSLVTHPERELGFWYRYTLLSTDSGHQEVRLWAGLTRELGDDFLTTRRYPLEELSLEEPFSLTFGDAELTDSSACGALDTEHDISWDFEYEPDDVTFTPLRSKKLTDFAEKFLGSGRHWSANQSVAMDGTLEVDGETYDFDGASGHQGHTVGETSPDGWSWLHCNCFDDPDACIEVLNVEGKTSLCFRRDGDVYMLNRLKDVVGPLANETVENKPGRWRVRAKGEGVRLDIRVDVDDEDKWRKAAYLTPDDTSRYVAHSSLSSVEVVYRVRDGDGWTDRRTLESDAARAEWSEKTPPVGDRDEYTPEEFA